MQTERRGENFPPKSRDSSSMSLAKFVKACTGRLEEILNLFPDEDEEPSHRPFVKSYDCLSKFMHGTDRKSIHGLSLKMIKTCRIASTNG